MLHPHLRVASVHEVTPTLLEKAGIRALLVDVDDTLLSSRADELEPNILTWFASLKAAGIPVAILSNGSQARVAQIAAEVGVPALSLAGKPFGVAFRRGLRLLGNVEPGRTAMVGDQLFTDVLGARQAGLKSILVDPLSPGKLPHTRLARRLERMVLRER